MLNDLMIGAPDIQADFSEMQIFDDNCAVCAEMTIIDQFRPDLDLTQADAAYISAENGWYMPGYGTPMEDIGNLMDVFGIENHTVTNATIADLASELQQGHGVIVSVNSSQLWETGPLAEMKSFIYKTLGIDNPESMPADHAITVTGIDMTDPQNPQVIINDSGVPDGAAVAYPLDKFMDAWENGNFYYTATNQPLPSLQEQNIGDDDFWGDFNWSNWLNTGFGISTAVGGLVMGDLGLTIEGGTILVNSIEKIMDNESFARTI